MCILYPCTCMCVYLQPRRQEQGIEAPWFTGPGLFFVFRSYQEKPIWVQGSVRQSAMKSGVPWMGTCIEPPQRSGEDRPDPLETLASLFLRYLVDPLCLAARSMHVLPNLSFPLGADWENQTPILFRASPAQNPLHESHTHSPNHQPARLGRKKDFAMYMHGTRCIVVGLVGCTFHGRAAKSVSTLRFFTTSLRKIPADINRLANIWPLSFLSKHM